MVVLTKSDTGKAVMELYRRFGGSAAVWSSEQVRLATQVIEDWYNGDKAQVSTDIDTATGGPVFNTAQKKVIFARWLFDKFKLENQ